VDSEPRNRPAASLAFRGSVSTKYVDKEPRNCPALFRGSIPTGCVDLEPRNSKSRRSPRPSGQFIYPRRMRAGSGYPSERFAPLAEKQSRTALSDPASQASEEGYPDPAPDS
jgi:hypothetical protein